jgi:AraC-like DNA-binding protein
MKTIPARGRRGTSIGQPRVMLFDERPVQIIHARWDRRLPKTYDMHHGLEIGIVLAGEMIRHYRGWKAVYGPGEVWFSNLWESHGGEVRVTPTEVVVLIIHPPALQQLRFLEAPDFTFLHPFSVEPSQRPRIGRAARSEALAIAAELLRHQESAAHLRHLQLRVLLMRIILLACADWNPPAFDRVRPRPLPESIEPALRLVADSQRFLPVTEAARACAMSVKVFRETFRSLMGTSFPKYALRYRVDGVASQLLQSDDPVKAIAIDWGFTDTSHLDHCFRRFYGCFPMEFRAERHAPFNARTAARQDS